MMNVDTQEQQDILSQVADEPLDAQAPAGIAGSQADAAAADASTGEADAADEAAVADTDEAAAADADEAAVVDAGIAAAATGAEAAATGAEAPTGEPTTEELTEFFNANNETFTFLSQMFFKELNQEAIDELAAAEWPQNTGNAHLDAGYNLLRRYFKFSVGDRRTQLAVEYARIFLAAGVFNTEKKSAVPYESVYTSVEHTVMGDTRDDVINWFIQDGFQVNPDLHEPEDHLSFMLEYLASMNEKAAALASDGNLKALRNNMSRQVQFTNEHLLNWLPTLNDIAKSYAKNAFYLGMLQVTMGALEQERDTNKQLLKRMPRI